MSDLILREFNGVTIRQREDGYFNLTDMAKATGKDYYDWVRLDSTIEFLSVISHNTGISRDILITSKQYHGTYGHKKIAIAFATWCSPEFFAVVIDWVEDILTKGYTIARTDDATLAAMTAEIEKLKFEVQNKRKLFLITLLSGKDVYDVTPASVFKVLDKIFPYYFFTLERRRKIVKAWKDERYINQSSNFRGQEDFINFLKCIGDNYYLHGVGGTGESRELKKIFADL